MCAINILFYFILFFNKPVNSSSLHHKWILDYLSKKKNNIPMNRRINTFSPYVYNVKYDCIDARDRSAKETRENMLNS